MSELDTKGHKTMRYIRAFIAAIVVLLCTATSRTAIADLIDFETGFQRLDAVNSVSSSTNVVTFSTVGMDNNTPFIAEVGTSPKDGFERVLDGIVMGDTPNGGNPGRYFLTDGAGKQNHYLLDFQHPISSLSLDLYDYVGDGGANHGDSVVLRVFSEGERTNELASSSFTVPRPKPVDGMTITLSVSAEQIRAATLEFSQFDRGTGIDNIRFTLLPEPSSVVLIALGLLSLVGGRGFRSGRYRFR